MAKIFGKCKLCKGSKFLNYAGLCKRCNKTKEAQNILNKVQLERKEMIAGKKESANEKEQEMEEMHKLMALEKLEGEQKKRLKDLETKYKSELEAETKEAEDKEKKEETPEKK